VSWMSAAVTGSPAIALSQTATGFSGTVTSSAPIATGTAVIVGTCDGALQGHATVTGVAA